MDGNSKYCPKCGSGSVVKLSSLFLKICGNCGYNWPWNLKPNQKPLI